MLRVPCCAPSTCRLHAMTRWRHEYHRQAHAAGRPAPRHPSQRRAPAETHGLAAADRHVLAMRKRWDGRDAGRYEIDDDGLVTDWLTVLTGLASCTTVCLYDRPGAQAIGEPAHSFRE